MILDENEVWNVKKKIICKILEKNGDRFEGRAKGELFVKTSGF